MSNSKYIVIMFILCMIISINSIASVVTSGRQTTTDGTPVQLSTTSAFCQTLVISAMETNTDVVVIGDSSVDVTDSSQKGLLLFPGQSEYINPGRTINLLTLYLDVEVDNEGVQWLCVNN